MTYATWFAFLCLALAASFSPGPGVLLAISNAVTVGARRTAYSSLGNAVGVFLVSCIAVSSIGLLFQRSPMALSMLRVVAAVYLAWLGVKQWRSAGKGAQGAGTGTSPGTGMGSRYALFRGGLMVACSNPKAIIFFAAVFPQFLPPGQMAVHRFLLLSLTFVACTFVSHLSYVLLAAAAGTQFLSGPGMARLQRSTGLLFIVLAVGMALPM